MQDIVDTYILELCCPMNQYSKIRSIGYFFHIKICRQKSLKLICLKWTYRHSGNDYRVAALSKMNLITKGVTMPCLKSIGQHHLYCSIVNLQVSTL